ncbi:hypothetical protein CA54_42860 [Symmachiella macrocystis]|uniref:LamG-like jellyroll fold domain-containing protein n=1 Tax=Symmachiella macrocystis TaxID=2527985 RepID=A0A5C6BCK9_9PLAN|nr:LamG domain-containing protein [Symmachiella macrocystis]TWU09046.1 hypothetical protein CA54_42860 [Symmachiella macrocystis]
MNRFLTNALVLLFVCGAGVDARGDDKLIGDWPLAGDTRDHSSSKLKSKARDIDLKVAGPRGQANTAGGFDGRTSVIEVEDNPALHLGTGEFSISLWANTQEKLDDVLGDLVAKYDAKSRTGFNLGILNLSGVTSTQSNHRHLYFGIDADKIDPEWTDCGRPGDNLYVCALCVYKGELYAGTFEHGADQAGHVYRYEGGQQWADCGSPDSSNAVQTLAVFDGHLYAGTGRYLAAGSALPESPNETPGGKVYRYEAPGQWIDCGKLQNPKTGESFTTGGLVVYQGALYAGPSKHPGRGLYRYEGGESWKFLGEPGHRVTFPVVHNGSMYFASLDGGGIERYDGQGKFTDVGKPEGITQSYGFAIYRGDLYSSTWPNGEVFRYGGGQDWINVGRLGDEKEVMGMAVYNGGFFAGTLPLAEVYRYDGGSNWSRTGQLDTTPDVKYRRAWSMAVHEGRLYCGTLPSGHVYSLEAGKSATYGHALPAGWVHLAAVRGRDCLRLYVNGKLVARSSQFAVSDYDISTTEPLTIGFGPQDHFDGKLAEVRLYGRALTDADIAQLAQVKKGAAGQ